MTVAGMIGFIRIERNPGAVVRPNGMPCLEFSFRNLHGLASAHGHHVEMVPSIQIAEERDPAAVGRWLRGRARIAGNAPELLFDIFMYRVRFTGGDVGNKNGLLLEVGRLALENDVLRVHPMRAFESDFRFQRHRLAARRGDHK